MFGAGVIPLTKKICFLITVAVIKILKAAVFFGNINNLVHTKLFYSIWHNIIKAYTDITLRSIFILFVGLFLTELV